MSEHPGKLHGGAVGRRRLFATAALALFALAAILISQQVLAANGAPQQRFTVGDLISQLRGFVWPLGIVFFVGILVSLYQLFTIFTENSAAKPLLRQRLTKQPPKELEKTIRQNANRSELGRLLAILYSLGQMGEMDFHGEVEQQSKVREDRFNSYRNWMIFLSDSAGAFGLLGTVWGMYQVFYFTGGVLDTQTTLAGMGTALVTTLVGIVISVILNLFATIMSGVFNRQIETAYRKADELRFAFAGLRQQRRQREEDPRG